MQVQSIANTKSDVNFKSAIAMDKATAFVNMNDSQVRMISYVSGRDKKQEKKNKNSLLRTFYAIPIVDTIASAVLVKRSSKLSDEAVVALRKTKLSTRLAHASVTAGFWAVSLSAIELYTIVKRSIQRNSPNMKKFDRENPATSFLTDLTAILVGGTLGILGLNRLAKNNNAKHPDRVYEAKRSLVKTRRLINESKFSKETLPKLVKTIAEFSEGNPAIAKAGRIALANSVWILVGVGFLKMAGQSKREHDRVETNYRNVKQAQLEVAKKMVSNLNNEKVALAEELKTTVDEKNQAEEKVEEIKKSCHKKETKEVKKNCCKHCDEVEESVDEIAEDTDTVEETTETESAEE